MAKTFLKKALALILTLSLSASALSLSASANAGITENTNGVRSTEITKYDADGDPLGAGYGFNIYDGDSNLLAVAYTDASGSFNLSDIPAVKTYFGFDDDNLHPADGNGKKVYIVDQESLSDPDSVIIPVDLLKDEGSLNGNSSKDKLEATKIEVDGVTVPAVSYTFKNFYHVNLGGWRVGNERGDNQFTIRGMDDEAVVYSNWASEWGVPIGNARYFPTSGKTYYYEYSRSNGVFSFKFDTDGDFEDCLSLKTTLDQNSLTYNYMLLWFRCPEGLTVTGTFGEDGRFSCVGKDGDYYNQAFYPALFPLETDNGDFSVSGTVTFHYGNNFTYDMNGNEVINFQFKGLYLPDCSAGFAPNPDYETENNDEELEIKFNSGDASNISFMLIDEATGEVDFLYKEDIEDETSFEIPAEDGKISAVFVKQSASGMFWFSEEVDAETAAAVIDCLAANNPSYKGYNAMAYGAGGHELEFKSGKFVTYTFLGAEDGGDLAFVNDKDNAVVEEPKKNKNKK